MASSHPRNRCRVGLSDPRAARAQATDAESQRLQSQQHRRALGDIVLQDDNLDVQSEEYVNASDNDFELEDSESDHQPPQARARPPVQMAAMPPAKNQQFAASAASNHPRNKYFWVGNDPKLNIVARLCLMQPQRQEMLAVASNDADHISEIRQLKWDQSKYFNHDNFKHSAHSFLVQKTCEELSQDVSFV